MKKVTRGAGGAPGTLAAIRNLHMMNGSKAEALDDPRVKQIRLDLAKESRLIHLSLWRSSEVPERETPSGEQSSLPLARWFSFVRLESQEGAEGRLFEGRHTREH